MKYPIEEWQQLYEDKGWSTVKIGKEYDVCDQTVTKHLRENGVEVPQPKYRHLVDDWIRLYKEEGWKLEDIADKYDKTTNTISKYLKNNGVEPSTKQFNHVVDEWAELYREGKTMYEIAEDYEVSASAVQKYLSDREDIGIIYGPRPEFEHLLDEWIELYKNKGLLVKEIAERYDAAATTICHYLNNAGVDTSPKKEYPVEEWINLYNKEDISTREIARRYNCGKDTVVNRLRKSGVKVKPHGKNEITKELILSRTNRKGQCWKWQGATSRKGYGLITAEYKEIRAHRASYRLWMEEIPDGHYVRHRCDNPSCVRPKHLTIGTHDQNMADMQRTNEELESLTPEEIKSIIESNDPWHEIAEERGLRIGTVRLLKE